MTRRTVVWSPLLLGLRQLRSVLFNRLTATRTGDAKAQGGNTLGPDAIVLENSNHKLAFDPRSVRLLSFRAQVAPDQEFAVSNDHVPVFVIQYLTEDRVFQQITSTAAQEVSVDHTGHTLTAVFSQLGQLELAAKVTVRMGDDSDPLSYWSIVIRNGAGLTITDVQFPFVIVRYQLGGKPGTEALLRPLATGRFWEGPQPQDLEPDSPHAWQFRPENTDTSHYPGLTFAQFLAYYNDRAGIYAACQDDSGAIKLIKPVHSATGGIRLGFSHVGDWPASGERNLGYDVVLQAFQGDWYEAAGLYREWSLRQKWAALPLHQRKDVPEWLLDSPPHIMVRMQGELDRGPTEPNQAFLPYPKIIPLLEKISQRIESPLVAVVMSWERPGPWVYPDCFPPVGGDESLREFTRRARERGWHVGSFCNGTRWVTHHFWSGYDGEKYLAEHEGEKTICRTHDGQLWLENWGQDWRPSYACCVGVPKTREIAKDFVQRLADDGLDWVQFLDQNVGCASFPCFAADHGHPPLPGKWMNAAMQSLLDSFRNLAAEAENKSGGRREFAFSVEYPPNEFFMPNFQVCDQRVAPPGHSAYGRLFFPLYTFLYHEFVVMQGGFGAAPEPYHMPIRNAYNLVMGEIPGGVVTGDGSLLNRDTFAWAPWSPAGGCNEDSLAMLRSTAALRRGRGRNYLVYGRMLRPSLATGIRIVHWKSNGQVHEIPAVFHSAWRTPKGRFGVVLANWTNEKQVISVVDQRLGNQITTCISGHEISMARGQMEHGQIAVSLPPLSCALLERA
ncbi:MAG TPA: DUF6259 domain-containing protein [Terriglobia bacterium]|nr:DUF6259 domain-containing protein [Terriglobia bacterium]